MIEKDVKLDLHDLTIKPATISEIESRRHLNPYYELPGDKKMLPIITAPMDTVIDTKNYHYFEQNKIYGIIPRGNPQDMWGEPYKFKAVSLSEFIKEYIEVNDWDFHRKISNKNYVLIDMANGHMKKLLETSKKAKEKYGDKLFLIVGNIANPKTFEEYAKIGVDAIRISIGSGNACLTAKQTTINYPMGSLIKECREIKDKNGYEIKIIADGGMKDYSDIILSLALGADFVMIGSLLNKALESCANTYIFKIIKINQYSKFAQWILKKGFKLTKKFRGMSTKEVQKKWGKKDLRTSEGVSKKQEVKYTLKSWVENFDDYLRTTMSYCSTKTLDDFIGRVDIIKISDKAYQRFNK